MGFVPAPETDWVASSLGPAPLLHKRRGDGERFFGCGERTSGLEKTGSRQIFWNVDPPQGHTASFNNLYTSIPFVLSLQDGRAHGFFVDYPGRSEVDLGKADPGRVTGSVASGDLVYYVFCGPTPRASSSASRELTGRTPMPPLWALGNQQSQLGLHGRRRGARDRRRLPRARHPVRRVYLDIDYMRRLPRLHVRRRALPGPGGVHRRARGRRVPDRLHHRPGREGRRGLRPSTARAATRDLYCRTRRRTRSTATSSGPACARSRTSRARHARVVGRAAGAAGRTRAWPACGAT